MGALYTTRPGPRVSGVAGASSLSSSAEGEGVDGWMDGSLERGVGVNRVSHCPAPVCMARGKKQNTSSPHAHTLGVPRHYNGNARLFFPSPSISRRQNSKQKTATVLFSDLLLFHV